MRYVGSKKAYMSKLNNHFNLAKLIYSIDTFYDLFAGGLNVSTRIDFPNIVSNDISQGLCDFIHKIQETDGHYLDDVSEGIDRDTYVDVFNHQNNYEPAYVYKILYIGGFRNMVRNTLNYGKNIEKHKEAVRCILRELDQIKKIDLHCRDYRSVDIKPGSLIYLDPPYKNSSETYIDMMYFDYDAFYQYCIEKAKNNIVYVSSYMMPKQFECVDVLISKERRSLTTYKYKGRDTTIKDECLWMVKGGFGVNDIYHNESVIDI